MPFNHLLIDNTCLLFLGPQLTCTQTPPCSHISWSKGSFNNLTKSNSFLFSALLPPVMSAARPSTYRQNILMTDFHLEAKTRFSQQEWNDSNVHNAVFIRPLLGVPVHNDYLTAKIVVPFDRFCSAKIICFSELSKQMTDFVLFLCLSVCNSHENRPHVLRFVFNNHGF